MAIKKPKQTRFDGHLPVTRNPSDEQRQRNMSLSLSKDRVGSNTRRIMGGGWLDLNNGAQAGP